MKRAAGADSADAATLSQGLKIQKIPPQGLIWGCPAPGKSRDRGACSCLGVPRAEAPWPLLGFGQVPVPSSRAEVCFSWPCSAFPEILVGWGGKKKEEKGKKKKKQISTLKQNRSAWVNSSRRLGEREKPHKHPPHPSSCLQYLFTPNRLIRIQGWPRGKNKG